MKAEQQRSTVHKGEECTMEQRKANCLGIAFSRRRKYGRAGAAVWGSCTAGRPMRGELDGTISATGMHQRYRDGHVGGSYALMS